MSDSQGSDRLFLLFRLVGVWWPQESPNGRRCEALLLVSESVKGWERTAHAFYVPIYMDIATVAGGGRGGGDVLPVFEVGRGEVFSKFLVNLQPLLFTSNI